MRIAFPQAYLPALMSEQIGQLPGIAKRMQAGTPPDPAEVTQRLYQEFKTIISQPDVAKQITERGLVAIGSSPEEFERSYRSDFDLITKRIREFGVEPQ